MRYFSLPYKKKKKKKKKIITRLDGTREIWNGEEKKTIKGKAIKKGSDTRMGGFE